MASVLEKIQAQFELGVAVTLFNWPALSLAVANKWGGPDSADKREWFAGAVCDLFAPTASRASTGAGNDTGNVSGSGAASTEQSPDAEDVEAMLLQVMLDEFEVNVDDDSAYDVAQQIMRLRETTAQGDFALADELYATWKRKGGGDAAAAAAQAAKFRKVGKDDDDGNDDDDEEDDDEEDDDDDDQDGDDDDDDDAASGSASGGSRREDGDEDVEMMDADADGSRRPSRRPAAPEVDEEGFTKVVGKKRR